MVMLAVEGTIHKFDLRNFIINKKLQFLFYKLNITEPKLLIYGRKAVTAGKGASPAALIINNAVFKLRKVAVCKRNLLKSISSRQPVCTISGTLVSS